jgi:hypothetical protein
MTKPAKVVVPIAIVLTAALLAGIVVGTVRRGFFYPYGLLEVASTFWGGMVLGDFTISLVFTGAWIVAVDKHLGRALLVGVATLILGNPVFLVYLALRSRRVATFEELLLARL